MIIVIAVVLCSLEQNIATDPFTDFDFIVLQLGTFSFLKKTDHYGNILVQIPICLGLLVASTCGTTVWLVRHNN